MDAEEAAESWPSSSPPTGVAVPSRGAGSGEGSIPLPLGPNSIARTMAAVRSPRLLGLCLSGGKKTPPHRDAAQNVKRPTQSYYRGVDAAPPSRAGSRHSPSACETAPYL